MLEKSRRKKVLNEVDLSSMNKLHSLGEDIPQSKPSKHPKIPQLV